MAGEGMLGQFTELFPRPVLSATETQPGLGRNASLAPSHPLQLKAASGERSWERKGNLARAGVSAPARLGSATRHRVPSPLGTATKAFVMWIRASYLYPANGPFAKNMVI